VDWVLRAMTADFFVHNLGCKVNRVESDSITAALLAAGGSQVARGSARVIVINTCTVTGEADTKTRKAIRQALASEHEPWVIATGCAVAIDKEGLAALGKKVIAEPDREQAKLTALELLGLTSGVSVAERFGTVPYNAQAESPPNDHSQSIPIVSSRLRIGEGFNTRMGIKIQDGCDNACTYCIVHVARGPGKSVDAAHIVEQVKLAEQSGVREVVLTGVNIGAYVDGEYDRASKGLGLVSLIAKLLQSTSELRIRLSSLEPEHAIDELFELMEASKGRVCAHLHLPLQSGCDTTLVAMARSYDTAFFAERASKAKKLLPHIALTTDLIVGFPSESETDFKASLGFCEQIAFSRMHVFRYSARPGTPAAIMPQQVAATAKNERSDQARQLAAALQTQDLEKRVGSEEKVLVERSGRATSESYHPVELSSDYKVGSLVPVRFVGYRDNLLIAQ
jgi:threonylcarbamoyladenosine tRNA methylthiotransferase MtaB